MAPSPVIDLVTVFVAYLAGSIPIGVIIARLSGAPDPRTVGSGRTGGTNALRAMGFRRGVLVAALDLAKGAIPVALAILLGLAPLTVAATGVAAVLGSWASVFLRFHGGRGVATGIGATLVIAPLVILLALPFFFGPILLTRYVSLGSLVGSAAAVAWLVVLVAIGSVAPEMLLFGVIGGALVWFAHRDNIGRLLRGEERRFDPFVRGE